MIIVLHGSSVFSLQLIKNCPFFTVTTFIQFKKIFLSQHNNTAKNCRIFSKKFAAFTRKRKGANAKITE
jgi:hypothetical protein